MKTFITIIITFFVTTIVTVGIVMGLKTRGKLGREKATVVRIEKPERGELIEFINAPGQIEPKRKLEISAKMSARIIEMPFKEGQRVTKGNPNATPPIEPSVLLRLDASDLKAALRSAQARRAAQAAQLEVSKQEIESKKAQIEGCQASLHEAKLQLQRQRSLLLSRDVSQSTVDQAQRQVDELKSQLSVAKNSLKTATKGLKVLEHNLEAADADITRAKDILGYTTIHSPIDGIITRINAEEGEMAMTGTMNNPGTVIMVVADLSQMLLEAQVDESDVGSVRKGQQTRVHIHAWPDKVFEGVVDSIALSHNVSQTGSKYFETKILIDTNKERILSGLTADVDIETCKHKDILKVPSQAVLGRAVDELPLEIRENSPEVDKKKTFAAVVYRCVDGTKDNEKKNYETLVTPVKVGAGNATHTIILSGITESDRIVVGPYKELEGIKNKQKIRDEREVEEEKKKKTDADKTKKSNQSL